MYGTHDMTAREWLGSRRYKSQVQDREYYERQSARAARTKTGRRTWSNRGGNVDQVISQETGGCFLATESGNRGDKGVMASLAYTPEIAEEEVRLVRNDRLRRFVSTDELEDRSWTSETHIVDDGVDEDGHPDTALTSVDTLAGPRYIALKGTVDEALEEVFRKSPKYVVDAYKMAETTGRLDVLNHLPSVVAGLVKEGVYSTQLFQQTPAGNGFSVYKTLKGHAATERGVIGPQGGIACRILEILQAR